LTTFNPEKAPDQLRIDSILAHGSVTPIITTDRREVIGNVETFIALKYINENKLTLKTKNADDSSLFDPTSTFTEFKVFYVRVQYENELALMLLVADLYKKVGPSYTILYNIAKHMMKILAPEAKKRRMANLSQNLDVQKIVRRHKKEDGNQSDADFVQQLYNQGLLNEEDLQKDEKFRNALKTEYGRVVDKIADYLHMNRTYINNLLKIGDLAADGDLIAKNLLIGLDKRSWGMPHAGVVITARILQRENKDNNRLYTALQKKIDEALNPELMKKTKERKLISHDLKEFKKEVNKLKNVGKVRKSGINGIIYIAPDNDYEKYNIKQIKPCVDSALFIQSKNEDLFDCINLMKKLEFTYKTIYNVGNNSAEFLLFGIQGNYPLPQTLSSPVITHIPTAIKDFYPDEKFILWDIPEKRTKIQQKIDIVNNRFWTDNISDDVRKSFPS
jgi:hypothetical protein